MYFETVKQPIHTEKCFEPSLSLGGGSSWSSGGSSSNWRLRFLGRSHKLGFVRWCLESSVAKLGRCIDELELDLLQCNTLGARNQSLQKKGEIRVYPITSKSKF